MQVSRELAAHRSEPETWNTRFNKQSRRLLSGMQGTNFAHTHIFIIVHGCVNGYHRGVKEKIMRDVIYEGRHR